MSTTPDSPHIDGVIASGSATSDRAIVPQPQWLIASYVESSVASSVVALRAFDPLNTAVADSGPSRWQIGFLAGGLIDFALVVGLGATAGSHDSSGIDIPSSSAYQLRLLDAGPDRDRVASVLMSEAGYFRSGARGAVRTPGQIVLRTRDEARVTALAVLIEDAGGLTATARPLI